MEWSIAQGEDRMIGPAQKAHICSATQNFESEVSIQCDRAVGTRFCLLPPPSGSFPTLGPPRPQVGRSRYGPKQQVQGDPVTLEKSSPNQTTWAGVWPRPHHFLPTFFNTNFHAVKATVNPPIPQTLVKWPGRVTGTQRKGVRPE